MNIEPKKVVVGLGAAFVLLSIWHNPQRAGDSTGDFIGKTSDFLQDAFNKADEFSKSVIE